MYLDEIDEICKGYLPYYLLFFLPIFIIISPANPVAATSEFPVYRLQHYDLNGLSHGSRSSSFNLEAKSLTGWNTSRHCIVTRFQDLTVDSYKNIKSKAGALLAMLPKNLKELSQEEKRHFMVLENAMIAQDTSIPVYFAKYSDNLDSIIKEVIVTSQANDKKKSVSESLINSIAGNGYQVVVTTTSPNINHDAKITTISGHLSGYSADGKIPTVAVVAHYDSFGGAPVWFSIYFEKATSPDIWRFRNEVSLGKPAGVCPSLSTEPAYIGKIPINNKK